MKNRDFSYKGIKYHLNDNIPRGEFEGKYKLLFWHEGRKGWHYLCTVDTKKEAMEYVKKNYLLL